MQTINLEFEIHIEGDDIDLICIQNSEIELTYEGGAATLRSSVIKDLVKENGGGVSSDAVDETIKQQLTYFVNNNIDKFERL